MISTALADALRAMRAECNAAFAAAKQRFRDLDGGEVLGFVRETIDPLAAAVAAVDAARVADVVRAAYDVGLELVGHRLAGPSARTRSVDAAWGRILTANPRLLLASPARLLAAVSNAVHQIESTPGSRLDGWIATMTQVAPQTGDVGTLLQVGQVSAWRAGLAHYRLSALAVAAQLPVDLARAALGLAAAADAAAAIAGWRHDPWFDPDGARSGLHVAGHCGAFRGFGGLFVTPPRVAQRDGNLLVASGGDTWVLFADRFGATLHRLPGVPLPAAPAALPADVRVEGLRVHDGKTAVEVAAAGSITSVAVGRSTIAVTTSHTHAVCLLARAPRT